MNEKDGKKRREWVKNAAIIFLTIMLVLTFFSNTIMNYSLPEVATQYVQSGTITAKVRGTGNVEATDPYNIKIEETRVIASVAVKQGDQIEKDQVIYYLEDEQSDELKTAEAELEDLKLTYMKGLFGSNVSSEVISKVANGNVDGFGALQAKVGDMQSRLEAAQTRVKECQDTLNNLTLQSTVNNNNSTINTIDEENQKAQASTDLSNAQTQESNAEAAFNRMKSEKLESLNHQIKEKQSAISDLETLIKGAENIAGSVYGSTGDSDNDSNNDSAQGYTAGGIDSYIQQREAAKQVMNEKLDDIYEAALRDGSYNGNKDINELKQWINESDDRYQTYATLLNDYDAAVSQYEIAVELAENASSQLGSHDDNKTQLEKRKAELRELEARLSEVNAMNYTPGDSVKEAQEKLNQADRNLTDKTNANKQASVAYQNQIANAEAALKNAQAVYDLLKEEQTAMSADINAELDLAKASRDIAKKEQEIAELREKSMGAAITSPVAGTVTSLAYAAGETTKPEDTAAVIQVEGKGYTMSVSVTNEQAKKVQVGDNAELQNAWYYDDVQVVLASIKPDPDDPGQKKLLNFDVTGSSLQEGQALNISLGQRSAEYEYVVPNSAVREDNNGKFILIVESKSSPLGNRYIASRVDVEVLASDDNNTAISAGLFGYEYVITTSTKPVEAGKQVRLNES
ncbi:MAG: HlyD family efflux transporter periplasmic adaptor subunit [Lachnospiraceae bacterium]|jgi:multidrug efflux pump subunit AcrA (membrane-fusion protein)|nr:HlyD family efflux transporter periplasmic adaptor subunit [Lachnospiraceae bacterium]